VDRPLLGASSAPCCRGVNICLNDAGTQKEVANTLPRPTFEPVMAADLVDQIDALLPQTQCKKCGYRAADLTPTP
jgi:hypothetical protein